ncbi:MAG: response regulator [Gammaproteobacteria bacterium]
MSEHRVLVVDDEAYVTHVLRQYLARDGYAVEVAANGEQALTVAQSFAPEVVITDVQMPRMNGQMLCEELIRRDPDTPPLLLVMTSRTDRDLRAWAATMGNAEFIEKPISPRRVLERVAAHFARPAAVAPA